MLESLAEMLNYGILQLADNLLKCSINCNFTLLQKDSKFMASMLNKIQRFITQAQKMQKGPTITRSEAKLIATKAGLPAPAWLFNDESYRQSHGVYFIKELRTSVSSTPEAKNESVEVMTIARPTTMNAVVEFARGVATCASNIDIGAMIPRKIDTYVPYGHFNDIKKIIGSNKFFPIFVTGLSGNGKTTMIEQICHVLNRECVRVNFTNFTDEDDLLGGFRLVNGESVWQDGPVIIAMQRGAVLLLDELDYGDPRKVNCLQSVLEHGRVFLKKMNRYVQSEAGFTIIATGNTKGQGGEGSEKFTGTNILNEAFLERFRITMEQEYPTKAVEKKIVMNLMGAAGCVEETFADNLVQWASIIRKSFYEGACDDIITTRRLEHIIEDFAIFGDRLKAITHCTARFSKDTTESFINLYAKVDAEVSIPEVVVVQEVSKVLDLDNCVRVDLLSAGFPQRYEVKTLGAMWDANMKVWYVAGEVFRTDRTKWSQYTPTANEVAGKVTV